MLLLVLVSLVTTNAMIVLVAWLHVMQTCNRPMNRSSKMFPFLFKKQGCLKTVCRGL